MAARLPPLRDSLPGFPSRCPHSRRRYCVPPQWAHAIRSAAARNTSLLTGNAVDWTKTAAAASVLRKAGVFGRFTFPRAQHKKTVRGWTLMYYVDEGEQLPERGTGGKSQNTLSHPLPPGSLQPCEKTAKGDHRDAQGTIGRARHPGKERILHGWRGLGSTSYGAVVLIGTWYLLWLALD